jgi:hypothetical protein
MWSKTRESRKSGAKLDRSLRHFDGFYCYTSVIKASVRKEMVKAIKIDFAVFRGNRCFSPLQ